MEHFKTAVEGFPGQEFEFICFPNTETIEIGDYYLFFFGGVAAVAKCQSEQEKSEANFNNRAEQKNKIDFVHNFWINCYKIKSSNFNIEHVD